MVTKFHSALWTEVRRANTLQVSQLLENLQAYKHDKFLKPFLTCCKADDFAKLRTNYPSEEYLLKCYDVSIDINSKDVENPKKGPELGKQIKELRIKAIESIVIE